MNDQVMKGFLSAVEFPKLLEVLSADCQTSMGKTHLKSFRPLMDTAVVESRLRKTQELEKHILKNNVIAIPDSQYFQPAFQEARTQGQILSGEELAALSRFLTDVIRLRQSLSPQEGIPSIFQAWLVRLHALPALQDFLKEKISDKGEVLDSASS
jgi:dsDNA-specific endonuclease/ATPase MutS2